MRALVVMPSLIALLGCSGVLDSLDTNPARLVIQLPTRPLLDDSPVSLDPTVTTEAGKTLPDEIATLTWSAVPEGIVEVSGGTLRCLRNGDVAVVSTGRGVSATGTVKCRIIAQIRGPKVVDLLVGEPGSTLEFQALDASGALVEDVEVNVKVRDPDMVEIRGTGAHGVRVGASVITAGAGRATLDVPVTVSERVQTATLALADGETVAYTLERGKYRVEVNVSAADGSDYGVTIQAAGGGCGSAAERTRHMLDCVVASTSSLVITNPTGWGFGPAEMGNLTIYRVP